MNDLNSKIESVLFTMGEPLSFKKLASLLSLKEDDIKKSVAEMKKYYEESKSGLDLVFNENEAQMRTSPRNSEIVSFFKKEDFRELSPSSLQTLSIIAYLGPLSKIEVDDIRGLNSVYTLRNLLMRGLIEKTTRDDKVKYRVTIDFLNFFGLNNVSDIPDYHELRREMLEKLMF